MLIISFNSPLLYTMLQLWHATGTSNLIFEYEAALGMRIRYI